MPAPTYPVVVAVLIFPLAASPSGVMQYWQLMAVFVLVHAI